MIDIDNKELFMNTVIRNHIISLIFNLFISISAFVCMFFLVKSNTKDFTIAFKAGKNPFKIFTIDSNIFMSLISFILIQVDILLVKKIERRHLSLSASYIFPQ